MTTSRILTTAIAAATLVGAVGFAYAQSRTNEQMNKDTDNATRNSAQMNDPSGKPAMNMEPNRMAPSTGPSSSGQVSAQPIDNSGTTNPGSSSMNSAGMNSADTQDQRMARADRN